MKKIAITGGIASGKTTASNFFKKKGDSYIFNADKESKKHLKSSLSLQKKIINIFGEEVVKNNKLSLDLLAKKAFSNSVNHKILNGIMWPELYILLNNSYEENKNKNFNFFIVDAALIFEANFQSFFDKIILITANKDLRLDRAVRRKNIPLESIQNRISLQLSDNKKKKLANHTIQNNQDLNTFIKKIERIYKKLL
jgi:dephospho-CoA kinase